MLSAESARRIERRLLTARDTPKPLKRDTAKLLIGTGAKSPGANDSILKRDAILQALVNLGFVKLILQPKSELYSLKRDLEEGIQSPPAPNLFTLLSAFAQAKRELRLNSFPDSLSLFVGETSLDTFLKSGITDFISLTTDRRDLARAIIAPSSHWCAIIARELNRRGLKTAIVAAETAPVRARKTVMDARNRKIDVIIGTSGFASLVAYLGPAVILVFDADSEEYECEPSRPDLLGILSGAVNHGSAVMLHHFKGAGVREIGRPPQLAINEWSLIDLTKWHTGDDRQNELVNLAIEIAKTTGGTMLIVQNRLGSASGFHCVQCSSYIACPRCDALLNFDGEMYRCSTCRFESKEILCATCGSNEIARVTEGASSLASNLASLLGEEKVSLVQSDSSSSSDSTDSCGEDAYVNYKIVVSTDVCLWRKLQVKATAVLIAGIEDKLSHDCLQGDENAASYLARIRGIYADDETKLFVATTKPNHPFFHYLRGDNPDYLHVRADFARRHLLPPYAPRVMVRVRAKEKTQAMKYVEQLRTHFGSEIVGDPAIQRGGSVSNKVWDIELQTEPTYVLRGLLVELGRQCKVKAIPFVLR